MKEFIMHVIIIKDILTNNIFDEKDHKKMFIAQEMMELLKDAANDDDQLALVLDFDQIVRLWMEDKMDDQTLINLIDDVFDEAGVTDLVNNVLTKVNRAYELKQIGEELVKNPILIDET